MIPDKYSSGSKIIHKRTKEVGIIKSEGEYLVKVELKEGWKFIHIEKIKRLYHLANEGIQLKIY